MGKQTQSRKSSENPTGLPDGLFLSPSETAISRINADMVGSSADAKESFPFRQPQGLPQYHQPSSCFPVVVEELGFPAFPLHPDRRSLPKPLLRKALVITSLFFPFLFPKSGSRILEHRREASSAQKTHSAARATECRNPATRKIHVALIKIRQ